VGAKEGKQKRDFFLRTDLNHGRLLFRFFGQAAKGSGSGLFGFKSVSDRFRQNRQAVEGRR
jgi:hypothetical protein